MPRLRTSSNEQTAKLQGWL